MADMTTEVERIKARGDKEITKFTGEIRSLENVGLELGDKFTISKDAKKYTSATFGEYMLVELLNDEGKVKAFFPSTMTKRRRVFLEDGTMTSETKFTQGNAAEEYRKHGSVANGMKALEGRTIEVTDVETIKTKAWNSNDIINANILTLSFVEEKKEQKK